MARKFTPDLPLVTGPVRVLFKDEGSDRGGTFGPVTVIEGAFGEKVGEEWMIAGWRTRAFARKVAKHYGVSLEEF